jgi:hypothetical protein
MEVVFRLYRPSSLGVEYETARTIEGKEVGYSIGGNAGSTPSPENHFL